MYVLGHKKYINIFKLCLCFDWNIKHYMNIILHASDGNIGNCQPEKIIFYRGEAEIVIRGMTISKVIIAYMQYLSYNTECYKILQLANF